MIRKILLLILMIAAVSPAALANWDGIDVEGGSLHLMKGEPTNVRMVREWVRMDVYSKYYKVTVQFSFKNGGKPTTVKMGFPEAFCAEGMENYEHGFREFHMWVDGRSETAKRSNVKISEAGDVNYISTYWVRNVSFGPGQTRIVRIIYKADFEMTSEGYFSTARYNFTGSNWAGTVGSSDLLAVLHLPGSFVVSAEPWLLRNGNRLSLRKTDWQPAESVTIGFQATVPGAWFLTGSNSNEYSYSERPFILESAGKNSASLWMPPIVKRNGRLFISMSQLIRHLESEGLLGLNENGTPPDPNGGTITLKNGDSYSFTPNMRFALDANKAKVLLSASPIFIRGTETDKMTLFVPLDSAAKIFNFEVSLDNYSRMVTLKQKH